MSGKLGNLLNISEPHFTYPYNSHGYTQLLELLERLESKYEMGLACMWHKAGMAASLLQWSGPPTSWSCALNSLVSEETPGSSHEIDKMVYDSFRIRGWERCWNRASFFMIWKQEGSDYPKKCRKIPLISVIIEMRLNVERQQNKFIAKSTEFAIKPLSFRTQLFHLLNWVTLNKFISQ